MNEELIAAMDRALLYRHHSIIATLLRAGCRTNKLQGHVYYRDHLANSFFHSLWSDSTVENMHLFLDCGYTMGRTEIRSLKSVCQQLNSHSQENSVLLLLKDTSEKPKSLTWLCRQTIRQTLMSNRQKSHRPMDLMIECLPIPSSVRSYLSVKSSRATDLLDTNAGKRLES